MKYLTLGKSLFLLGLLNTCLLFPAIAQPPSVQASNILATDDTPTEITLNWTRGNGQGLYVLMSANPVASTPTMSGTYTANSVFGLGQNVSTDWYVVYSGTGTFVTVTGLASNTEYKIYANEWDFPSDYHNGTNTGNPINHTTLSAGNSSLDFDGVDDHILVGNLGTMPAQGTFEAWVWSDVNDNNHGVFETSPSNTSSGFRIETDGANNLYLYIDDNPGLNNFYTNSFPTSQWVHIAFTWDTSLGRVVGYANGVEVFNNAVTTWPTNLPEVVLAQAYNFDNTRKWDGQLDEVRLWQTERTSEQINTFMGVELTGAEPGLMLYYDFSESTGTNTADDSGNGFLGTLQNGTAWVTTGPTLGAASLDTTPPTPSITFSPGFGPNDSPTLVEIDFNEPVVGFEQADLSVTNAVVADFTNVNGQLYTALLYPLTDGVLTVDISGAAAQDLTGNASNAAAQFAPTMSIPQNAVTFDGTGDYIAVANAANIDNLSVGTVEAWIRTSDASAGFKSILSNDPMYGLFIESGVLVTWDATAVETSGTFVADGQWHHVAMVFQHGVTNGAQFYVDGVPAGPAFTHNGNTGITGQLNIGRNGNQQYFTGEIDEVRIWNDVRTPSEILNTTYTELNLLSESNLVLYFTFNQDAGSGAPIDLSGAGAVATLFADADYFPSGALADISGPTVTISSSESGSTALAPFPITITFNESVSGFISSAITVSNGTVANFSGSGTTYTADIYPVTNGSVTVDVFAGVAFDAATNSNSASNTFSINATIPQNAAFFDGTTGQFNLGDSFDNLGALTIEAWIYWNGVGGTFNEIWSKETINSFAILKSGGKLSVNFGNGASWSGSAVASATTIPTNQWVHVAATRDGSGNVKMYINGVLDANTVVNNQTGNNANQRGIGYKPGATMANGGFNGRIDELRIWNVERTRQQIIDNAYSSLSAATGLVASYTFNNSSGSAIDAIGAVNGTLTGGVTYAASTAFSADVFAPVVSISSTESGSTSLAPFPITIEFSESVADFVLADITVTNGTAANFAGSGTSYTADIYPTADGQVDVDVAAGVATDASANGNFAATTFSVTATLPENALTLDGTGDYVTVPFDASYNTAVFTVEVWAKVSGNANNYRSIISSRNRNAGTSGEGFVLYASSTNTWEFWTGNGGSGGTGWNIIAGPAVVTDTWTHLAGVYDGSEMRFYVNGQLIDSQTVTYVPQDAIDAVIGAGNEPIDFPFNGQIDELRIWSTARTQQQIIDNAYMTVTSGPVASYTFNNSSGPAIDAAGTFDGTLMGGVAYVASAAFTTDVLAPLFEAGYPLALNIAHDKFDLTIQLNEIGSVYFVVVPDAAPAPTVNEILAGTGSGGTGEVTAGTFAIPVALSNETVMVAGLAPSTAYDVYIVAQDDEITPNVQNAAVKLDVITTSPPNYALDFDGADDYVNLGNSMNAVIGGTNQLTVEAWVYRTSGKTFHTVVGNYTSGGIQFLLRLDSDKPTFWVSSTGTPSLNASGATSVPLNTWTHVAGTYDGATLRVYMNGVLDGTTAMSSLIASSGIVSSSVTIGGNPGAPAGELMQGAIDELRIWTVARSEEQIVAFKDVELSGSEVGLLAYHDFSAGPNSGVTFDQTPNGFNGPLQNMDVANDWVVAGHGVAGAGTLDTTPPAVVGITSGETDPTTTSPFSITITFDEAVYGLTDADFTVTNGTASNVTTGNNISWTVDITPTVPGPVIVDFEAGKVTDLTGNPNTAVSTPFSIEYQLPNYALAFDGSGEYVNIPHNSLFNFGGGDFTISFWVNPSGTNAEIVSKRANASATGLLIGIMGGSYTIWASDAGGSWNIFNTIAFASVDNNTWTHISVVKEGSNWKFYKNGSLVNTFAGGSLVDTTEPISLGRDLAGVGPLAGQLDEVRIWNVARSSSQINAFKDVELNGGEPNLVAYYDFSDGPNQSVLTDRTANLLDGTLQGMEVATDWIVATHGVADAGIPDTTPPVVVGITSGETDPTTTSPFSITITFDEAVYGLTDADFTVSNGVASNVTTGNNITWTADITPAAPGIVSVDFEAGKVIDLTGNPNTAVSVPFTIEYQLPNYALDFDGVNDIVSIPSSPGVKPAGEFTVEAWFFADSYTNSPSIIRARDNLSQYAGFNVGFSSGGQVAYVASSTGFSWNISLASDGAVSAGAWHHIAITMDNSQTRMYVDGVLQSGSSGAASLVYNSGNVFIGGDSDGFRWDGKLDEIRIWNYARSGAEILADFNNELNGAELGLTAYYNFNQTTGTILPDESVNTNNGALNNFALTGSTSNWVGTGPTLGGAPTDVTPPTFNALAVNTVGTTTIDVDYDISETSTLYYLVINDISATVPTINNVINFGTYSDEPNLVLSGSVGSASLGTLNLTGLVGGSMYDLYFVAVDGAGNPSVLGSQVDIMTLMPNYALAFDGVDDYVAIPAMNINSNTVTMEAWIKPSGTQEDYDAILMSVNGSDYHAGMNFMTGHRLGYHWNGNDGSTWGFAGGPVIATDTWQHVAMVIEPTQVTFYLNGVPTVYVNNHIPAPFDTETQIAHHPLSGGRFFTGEIDEVRIWNVSRTNEQINAFKDVELAGNEPGLIGYWNFSDGSGDNVVPDVAGNGFIGTMTDMDNATDYVAASHGVTEAGAADVAAPAVVSITSLETDPTTTSPFSITITFDEAVYGLTDADFTVTNGTASNVTTGNNITYTADITPTAVGTVTVDFEAGKVTDLTGNPNTAVSVPFTIEYQLPENALDFDGVDDFVTIPRTALPTGLTFEAWINTTSTDATSTYGGSPALTVVGDQHNNTRGGFGVHNGVVQYTHWSGSGLVFDKINGSTLVNDGNWHHIAVTHDPISTEVNVYVDGILDGTGTTTTYFTVYSFNRIGGGYLDNTGTADFFDGQMDRVRMWGDVRTQAEIIGSALEDIGSGDALIAAYDFNAAPGTSLLVDISGNVLNGTLTNFNFSGTSSDWVASTVPACLQGLTFTAAADNNWFNSANWCGGIAPDIAEPQTNTIIIEAGTISLGAVNALGEFELTNADIIIMPGATLDLNFAGTGMTLAGTARIVNYGTLNLQKSVTFLDNSDILNYGQLNIASAIFFSGVNNTLSVPSGAVLRGTNTINGSLVVAIGATFAPGASPGCTPITGDYTNAGTLEIELGGTIACTEYDQVQVSGTAFLGGTLNALLFGGFIPTHLDEFIIIDAAALNGTFDVVNLPDTDWSIEYNYPNTGEVSLVYSIMNDAISFDGINDFVNLGNDASLSTGNIQTMEAWVQWNTLSGVQEILSKAGSSAGIELVSNGSNLGLYVMSPGNVLSALYSLTNLSAGQWYHIAGTWNNEVGEDAQLKLYVNGVEVASNHNTLAATISDPANFYIGTLGGTQRFFNGLVDEVKLWNRIRSATEIANSYDKSFFGNENGLIAYYDGSIDVAALDDLVATNDGTISGATIVDGGLVLNPPANPSITVTYPNGGETLTEGQIETITWDEQSIPSSDLIEIRLSTDGGSTFPIILNDGNFSMFNGSYDWTVSNNYSSNARIRVVNTSQVVSDDSDADFTIEEVFPPAAPTDLIAYSFSATGIGLEWTDVATDNTGYLIESASDYAFTSPVLINNVGDVNNVTFDINPNEGRFFRVTATNGAEDASSISSVEFANTTPFPGYALDFDGVDDYVEVPFSADLNPTTFTLEAWAHVTGGENTYRSVVTSRNNAIGYLIYANADNNWEFTAGNGSTWVSIIGPPVVLNEWVHVALSVDNSTSTGYINGVMVGSLPIAYVPNTSQPLRIGAGATEGAALFHFPGIIDEVKIWSSVKTDFSDRFAQTLGNESGLVAYFPLDENVGINTVNRSRLTTDGDLINGPTWVASNAANAPPTPVISSTTTTVSSLDPFQITITFDEEVTGFDISDITVVNGAPSNLQTIDNITFTADITPTTAYSLTVDVNAGVAVDLSANTNVASNQWVVGFNYNSINILGTGIVGEIGLNNFLPNTFEAVVDFTGGNYYFKINNDAAITYGDNEPDGFGDFGGIPINAPTGLYHLSLNVINYQYTLTEITTLGLLGDALPGGWTADVDMIYQGNGVFTLTDVEFMNGFWKVRANDAWAQNWGDNEPDGFLETDGSNIAVPAGTFDLYVDLINRNYAVTGNYALNFDDTNDYVTVAGLGSPAGDFTLEAWVWSNGVPDTWDAILEFDGDSPWFGLQNGILELYSGIVVDPNPLPTNEWVHVAVTFNDLTDNVYLYVNGIEVAAGTYAGTFTGGPNLGIGSQSDGVFEAWNGRIDEVRIWNIARSEGDIQSTMGGELIGNEAGLIAYYNFNEGTGSTIADVSGNGFVGSLVGFNVATDWIGGFEFTQTVLTPEINVKGTLSNVPIGSGSVTISAGNDTDFGVVNASQLISATFTIENTGNGDLDVTNITVDGDFGIDGVTLPVTILSGNSLNFAVTFQSSVAGPQQGTVSIFNNDADENPYTFVVGAEVSGDGSITEDFETLVTAGYIGKYTLPSGGWELEAYGEDITVLSGAFALGLDHTSGGFAIAPAVNGDGTDVSFSYATNGGESHFTVWKSVNGGSEVQIGGLNTSTSSNYVLYQTTLNEGPGSYVYIRIQSETGSDGNLFIDDFSFVPGNDPCVNAPYLNIGAVVVLNESAPGAGDGSIDANGQVLGGSGSHEYDWYVGTGTGTYYASGLTITGLNAGTYTFVITDLISGCTSDEHYFVINSGSGDTAPINQAYEIVFTNVQQNTADMSWTNGDGSARVVLMTQGTAVRPALANDFTYTPNSQFGFGDNVDGWFVIYNGTDNLTGVVGLADNTEYTAAVYEYNGASGQEKYLNVDASNNPNSFITTTSGFTNPALSFTAGGQSGIINGVGNLFENQTLTVEAWVRPANTESLILSSESNGGWGFYVTGGLLAATNMGFSGDVSSISVPSGVWSHVAISYNNGTLRYYLDGQFVEEVPFTLFSGSGNGAYTVGARTTSGQYTQQDIDELRVWNTVRPDGDILADYDNFLVGNEPGLIAYFKMSEAGGLGIGDSSPSGLSATLLNGVTWVEGPVLSGGGPAPVISNFSIYNITSSTLDVDISVDQNATLYYVISENGTAPTPVQIQSGLDGVGAAAFNSLSFGVNVGFHNFQLGNGTFTPPALAPNTGYYIFWVAEAGGQFSDVVGQSFTTLGEPVITVLAPNGGESVEQNALVPITWTLSNFVADPYLVIEYSNDGGTADWFQIAEGNSYEFNGSFYWFVDVATGANYKVRVRTDDGQIADDSDGIFEVSAQGAPSITLLYPNGGEEFQLSDFFDVEFTTTGLPLTTELVFEYSANAGTDWAIINSGLLSEYAGKFPWYLDPLTFPSSTQYMVRVRTVDGTFSDASDNVFTVNPAPPAELFISAPTDNDQLEQNTIVQVNIGYNNFFDFETPLVLEYATDGGFDWFTVTSGTLDSFGSGYLWFIDAATYPTSTNYKLRLRTVDSSVSFETFGTFTVNAPVSAPTVSLLAPNGENNFRRGDTVPIRFTTAGLAGTSQIEISYSNDGIDFFLITQDLLSNLQGVYDWVLNDTYLEGSYFVRVMDVGSSTLDVSDAPFTLTVPSKVTLTTQTISGGNVAPGASDVLMYVLEVMVEEKDANLEGMVLTLGGTAQPTDFVELVLLENTVNDFGSATPVATADYPTTMQDFPPNSALWLYSSTYPAGTTRYLFVSGTLAPDATPGATFSILQPNQEQFGFGQAQVDITGVTSGPSFTVNTLPAITVITPNGGEIIQAGEPFEITWSTTGIDGADLIEIGLSTNGGATYSVIDDGTFDTYNGVYNWIIPALPSAECLIRVRNVTLDISDVSDAIFTIQEPQVLTAPTEQASAIQVSGISDDGAAISWTNGNGSARIVAVRQGTGQFPATANDVSYTANTQFGQGDQAGQGWFVVYNGTGTSVNITGLAYATVYSVAVLEYNSNISDEVRYNIDQATQNPRSFTSAPVPNSVMHFDGVDDYVQIPDNSFLNLGATFSIEAYVKPGAANSGFRAIIDKRDAVTNNSNFSMSVINGTDFGMFIKNGAQELFQVVPGVLQEGRWNLLTATYDGTNLKMYVDGHLVHTFQSAVSFTNLTVPIQIGRVSNNTELFNGELDEVRIWTNVLKPDEIAANTGKQLNGLEFGLIAYYNFNNGVPSGNNTAVTSVTNSAQITAPLGINGSLQNFALTGNTSNFLLSAAFDVQVVAPTIQATSVSAPTSTTTSLDVEWTNGNGARRIVAIYPGTIGGMPDVSQNTYYLPNSVLGQGARTPNGWYVVYNGTGSAVTITGLTPGILYTLAVVESNGPARAEQYNLTTSTGNPAQISTPVPTPDVTLTTLTLPSANLRQGKLDNLVYKFKMNVVGGSVTVNSITMPISGTVNQDDFVTTGFKLYQSVGVDNFAAATLIATNTYFAGMTNYTVNRAYASGDVYYYLTTSINTAAVPENTFLVQPLLNDVNIAAPRNIIDGGFGAGATYTIEQTPNVTFTGSPTFGISQEIDPGDIDKTIYRFNVRIDRGVNMTSLTLPYSGDLVASDVEKVSLLVGLDENEVTHPHLGDFIVGTGTVGVSELRFNFNRTFEGPTINADTLLQFWVDIDLKTTAVAGRTFQATPAANKLVFNDIVVFNGLPTTGLTVTVVTPDVYCNPNGQNPGVVGPAINNVDFLTIQNNTTGANTKYYNLYQHLAAGVISNTTVPVTITSDGTPGAMLRVWVDWNQDLDFSDQGEWVIQDVAFNGSDPLTVNVAIPAAATPGLTRMRIYVYTGVGRSDGACVGGTPFTPKTGQIEDYGLSIVEPNGPTRTLPATQVAFFGFRANWVAQPGANFYRLDIADNPSFNNPIVADRGVTATSFELTGLKYDKPYYYRVRVAYPAGLSANSNVTMVRTLRDQFTAQDSLALVNIYDATGGNSWTRKENWKAVGKRLETWQGVTMTGTRVTAVNLATNKLTGSIPQAFVHANALQQMTSLDLSGNELYGIKAIEGLTGVTDLNVSDNYLVFDDLEPLVGTIATLNYAPQKPVGESTRVIVPRGSNYTVSFTAQPADTYQWNRNGEEVVGQTNTTYEVLDIRFETMGDFTLSMTDNDVPGLTLVSANQTVLASGGIEINVRDLNGLPLNEGTGYLMKIGAPGVKFDTTLVVDFVDGDLFFDVTILGDYLISVEADETLYLPTYYEQTFLWEEADTLFFRDVAIRSEMAMTVLPGERDPEDIGLISGYFEIEVPDEGARVDARRRAANVRCHVRRRVTGGREMEEPQYVLIASVTTNENGEFDIPNLAPGFYRLNIEYPGVPMDQNSFVEFEIGADGDNSVVQLAAAATENGVITVEQILPLPVSAALREMKVYPNPATDRLSIQYEGLNSNDIRLALYDINGRMVKEMPLPRAERNVLVMPLDELNGGLYFLNVIDTSKGQLVTTFKVVVKR